MKVAVPPLRNAFAKNLWQLKIKRKAGFLAAFFF